jgi:hypothetical protein
MKKGDLVRVLSYKGFNRDTIGIIVGKFQVSPGCPRGFLVFSKGIIQECYRHMLSQRLNYIEHIDGRR